MATSYTMATQDDLQTFLEVMANLHILSTPDAAKNVTGELLDLRRRDQDNRTIINRLREDNFLLNQQSEAATEERQEVDGEVKSLREKLAQLGKDWADINRVAEERGRRLREESAKVTQLEQHRVKLVRGSKEDVVTRWSKLWTYVNQVATAFFSEDLEEDTLREAHEFAPGTSLQYPRAFPSPATNTTEAKQMRIVAVSSIIASALAHHIFRPIGTDAGLEAAMSDLATANPAMESFYRSCHLAVLESLPEYRLSLVARAVKAAVKEITGAVACLLTAEGREAFQGHVEKVCGAASEEWQAFQRYGERYEVDMDGDKSSYDHAPLWKPAKENSSKTNGAAKTSSPGQAPNGQASNGQRAAEHAEVKTSSSAIVASVWPHLKVVGAASADPGISGLALFMDQTRRAQEEVKRGSRRASREEGKQGDRKSGRRPASLGAFLQGSPKVAQEAVIRGGG